ncbi:Flp pilus assembly protein CpaB [Thalassobaculum sp.]|uniref:Flp pilus assembly protein CpaB n=1 Tax=Thalassobaculum sp. TaxID=2022740 RepID=UPI0032EC9335
MPRLRTILLLAVAVASAGVTTAGANRWLEAQREKTLPASAPVIVKNPTTRVLVAAADLPAGQILRAQHLQWADWPAEGVKDDFVRQGDEGDGFEGAVVRSSLLAGEPVTDRRIARPGDRGFLAAMLTPGYRAVSVEVDAATGIAGLVFPGDRVDVVLTHVISQEDQGPRRRASETVLQNIRVLALDQRVDDQTGKPLVAKTATLELTAKQVELVTVAAQLGRLSLSLCSLASAEDGAVEQHPAKSFTLDSEASSLLSLKPAQRPKAREEQVTVIRGSDNQSRKFPVGWKP